MNVGDGMVRSLRWAAVATAVAVVGVATPALAAASTATLTVGSTPQGRIANDFAGLSFEMRELGMPATLRRQS